MIFLGWCPFHFIAAATCFTKLTHWIIYLFRYFIVTTLTLIRYFCLATPPLPVSECPGAGSDSLGYRIGKPSRPSRGGGGGDGGGSSVILHHAPCTAPGGKCSAIASSRLVLFSCFGFTSGRGGLTGTAAPFPGDHHAWFQCCGWHVFLIPAVGG